APAAGPRMPPAATPRRGVGFRLRSGRRARPWAEAIMRIYTKAGDDGTTGLFLGGRVSKGDVLVDACGDIDEAVSLLGVARAACPDRRMADLLFDRQRDLFVVAADLATNPEHRNRLVAGFSQVTVEMVDAVEALIDALVAERPLRPVFIVPGATTAS